MQTSVNDLRIIVGAGSALGRQGFHDKFVGPIATFQRAKLVGGINQLNAIAISLREDYAPPFQPMDKVELVKLRLMDAIDLLRTGKTRAIPENFFHLAVVDSLMAYPDQMARFLEKILADGGIAIAPMRLFGDMRNDAYFRTLTIVVGSSRIAETVQSRSFVYALEDTNRDGVISELGELCFFMEAKGAIEFFNGYNLRVIATAEYKIWEDGMMVADMVAIVQKPHPGGRTTPEIRQYLGKMIYGEEALPPDLQKLLE